MRKLFCIFVLILMACVIMTGTGAAAAKSSPPRIILYTYYRQMGWGDSVQIGWVDRDGGLWLLTGNDSELHWPYKTDEQLAYLRSCTDMARTGTLSREELFALRGMAASVPAGTSPLFSGRGKRVFRVMPAQRPPSISAEAIWVGSGSSAKGRSS